MGRLHIPPARLSRPPAKVKPPPKQTDSLYKSTEWKTFIAGVKKDRGNACEKCGSSHRVIGDHIIEVKDGGPVFDPANIRLLCIGCHNAKTARARRDREAKK